MQAHPILYTLAIIAGLFYISGAYLMIQMRKARHGYEDEAGFHFSDPIEDIMVEADEVRPAWFTDAVAARFAGQRAQIFAGTPA
ncbi:MAG TPA: hypothetical protein VFT72_07905 [Opitutaceae bacterium]|nr:hypothetical protein [Opitutaceae bacterium]